MTAEQADLLINIVFCLGLVICFCLGLLKGSQR